MQLLEYSNRVNARNEIIALRSPKVAEIKGSINLEYGTVVWGGYDVISIGNWSLLEQGVFSHPDLFEPWVKLVPSGLLNDLEAVEQYRRVYEEKMARQLVEELPQSEYGIEGIEVGRITI
jgi:hypothetical protein